MKHILVLFSLLLTIPAQAASEERFVCIAKKHRGSYTFYTRVESYFGNMRVRTYDTYYGGGDSSEYEMDRTYLKSRKGAVLTFLVPGEGTDQVRLTINLNSSARMPGGKTLDPNSRVHHAFLQQGNEKPQALVCELLVP